MFISNGAKIPTVTTNEILGKYLVKRGLPLLQRDKNRMTFSKTKKLDEMMTKIPLSVMAFGRVVKQD